MYMGEGDTVISHQEHYSYPVKDERGKVLRWDISRYKKVTKFYCAKKSCLLKRHQYAWKGLLVITEDSREYFTEEHYIITCLKNFITVTNDSQKFKYLGRSGSFIYYTCEKFLCSKAAGGGVINAKILF